MRASLASDEYRPVSAFMPCRVSIYQTSGGEVFIARMNTADFLEMMPPEVAEIMAASDEEIAEIIARTVHWGAPVRTGPAALHACRACPRSPMPPPPPGQGRG